MSKDDLFFYDHIGHMQISVLTLSTFKALFDLTGQRQNVFVPWSSIIEQVQMNGFSKRQSENELERFCYGFECTDRLNSKNERQIALTNIGVDFLNSLVSSNSFQSCQFAFLMRPSKRNNFWNVTIQESTFFNPGVYDFISQYKFRKGPARDYLRSISLTDLFDLLDKISSELSIATSGREMSIDSCIEQVENHGKFWASVGGKYSWFVFWQHFELCMTPKDWTSYDNLVKAMIRPPEWGGGKDLTYNNVIEILKTEERFDLLRRYGLFRPLWKTSNIKEALFRLTAAGYLMWERKMKGPIYEWWLHRSKEDSFTLYLCNATDLNVVIRDMKKSVDGQQGLYINGDIQKVISTLDLSLSCQQQIDLS